MRPTPRWHSVQRIISIPIARQSPSKILTYYHFQLHDSSAAKAKAQEGWVSWAQEKASATWSGFGKAPEGSWKLKVFRAGERIVDRVDFEELSLKSVDPELGPTILHPDFSGKKGKEKEKNAPQLSIPLLFPASVYTAQTSLDHLRQLLSTRGPRHRRGIYLWIGLIPFTAPFMLIPVIPNLPFFFCVWRSWSHYRAYRASQYLSTLVENKAIVPEPSDTLDAVYTTTPDTELLLAREVVPTVVSSFDLSKSATKDIYRAIEQANTRFEKAKTA
ncbi:hypothetical protein AAF712_005510 [Marasmius tenuissimus]|uniref:Uncharacterized protein n=1 Tax=Marasmius tenuissimus TaxID=585030 RepID=A0ABR3A2C2_9AGAR